MLIARTLLATAVFAVLAAPAYAGFDDKNAITATVTGAHVSDETVYKYVKAVAENQDRVQKIGGSIKIFTTAGMARNPANLPYHPGALRYYKEKGLVK